MQISAKDCAIDTNLSQHDHIAYIKNICLNMCDTHVHVLLRGILTIKKTWVYLKEYVYYNTTFVLE